ncbi:hypothetical protein NQ317_003377 [Molorchus minor]|uniref:Uncharacterized protein n=1 Tax=Molorchus minor TaxID=1323400 RepID=A0ABQ9K7Q8_9CUCU|nr:hypothetical protein NQ317_003377 [Molorchus minor]
MTDIRLRFRNITSNGRCGPDGVLCCSYNYGCGDDTGPVGFDGVVASGGGPAGHYDGAAGVAEETPDVTKQYNSAFRMVNNSAGLIYVSDSARDNKTERNPPGG